MAKLSKDALNSGVDVDSVGEDKTPPDYHINPGTGRPNICRAKIQCEFGPDAPHFESKKEAREYYEAHKKDETVPAAMSKTEGSAETGLVSEEIGDIEDDIEQVDWSDFEPSEDELKDFGEDLYEDYDEPYSEYDDDEYYEDYDEPKNAPFKFSFDR